jgi:Flp pilus assembly protein TadD
MQTRRYRHWPVATLLATLALAGCSRPAPPEGAATPRLADAALQAGYPQMALSVADHILARDPNNVPALVARGDALTNSARTDDAAEAYRKALAVKPADPAANLGLGRIMLRRDPHAAERLFRTALASRPDDAVLLADLGVALDLQERHVEAQTAYRHSLRIAPGAAATKANLGLSLALSGNGEEARRLLAPLAADPSATQVVRDNLAVAQMQAVVPTPAPPTQALPPPAQPTAPQAATAAPAPVALAPPIRSAPVAASPVTPRLPVAAVPAQAAPPTAVAAAPVTSPPAPAATAGAYVQLAASDSQEAAEAEWQRERGRTGTLLYNRAPQISEAVVNGRSFWRLRVPVATPHDGERLCADLRAKGASCWTGSAGS